MVDALGDTLRETRTRGPDRLCLFKETHLQPAQMEPHGNLRYVGQAEEGLQHSSPNPVNRRHLTPQPCSRLYE